MLIFIDEYGKHHSAMAEIKETKGVNGEKSISGTIFTNDEILEGIGRGWKARFNNENYYLTYAYPIDEGNRIEVEFDAVHEFFFNMKKSVVHDQLDGSHTMAAYLDFIFKGSGYTYSLEVTVSAFEKQSFGYKDRLTLFNDIVSSTNVEFTLSGNHVRILKEIGSDLSSIVKKGFNMNELKIEKDIGSFITVKKGYGAYFDKDDPTKGRLTAEYVSPLADIYGYLEGEPVIDEHYAIKNNLLERLKKEVEESYGISATVDMEDLTQAGYEYDKPHEGDYIMAINEDLKFSQKVRITSYTTEYDTTGRILNHEVSCGSADIVSKMNQSDSSYKKQVQSDIDEVRTQASIAWLSADKKSTIYWGEETPVGDFKIGDTWYHIQGEETVLKYWNGYEWVLFFDPKANELLIKDALDTAEQAKKDANSAYEKAVQDANSLVTEAESAWDAKLAAKKADIDADIATVYKAANKAQTEAEVAHQEALDVAKKAEEIAGQVTDVKKDVAANAQKAETAHQEAVDAAERAEQIAEQVGVVESDVAGNKSTIAQLAGQITTVVNDVSDNKSSITQQANQIVSVVKDVNDNKSSIVQMAGQISSVVADVGGNKASITQQGNQITSIVSDVGSNKSSIAQLSDRILTIVEDVAGNQSSITQTNSRIDSIVKDVAGNASAIVQTTNQITSIVKDVSDNKSSITQLNNQITSIVSDVGGNKSSIVQLTNQISSVVTDVQGNSSMISQMSDNISLKVDKNDVISSINLSVEGVRIQGSKIYLDGDVIMNSAWVNKLYADSIFVSNLEAKSISAISANITSIVTNHLAANAITANMLKSDTALIDKLFATTALIETLTSKTAFINSIKAIEISANKINGGTINAQNVTITNMNAANITSGYLNAARIQAGSITADKINATTLSAITANLGTVNAGTLNGVDIIGASIRTFMSSGTVAYVEITNGTVTIKNSSGTIMGEFTSQSVAGGSAVLANRQGQALTIGTSNGSSLAALMQIPTTSTTSSPVANFYGRINFTSGLQVFTGKTTGVYPTSSSSLVLGVETGVCYIGRMANSVFTPTLTVGCYATSSTVSNSVSVSGSFSVSGSKNAIHGTRDGIRATPAYEMAESYLGDIGRNYTNEDCEVWIEIDQLFSDTVNTDIAYEVFLQAYDDACFWVSDFKTDKFLVKSDKPLKRFAWELKAKRRGFEGDRLVEFKMTQEEIENNWRNG